MSQEKASVRGRLVIVDDEPVILDLLRAVFQGEPYDVVTATDGKSALQAMEQGVDVLLTDKNLPDIGGLELVHRAKAQGPDVECLVITGYASLDTALKAMELDVFDYIIKPPKDIFDVRRKVRQAFEKQAVVRENVRLLRHLQDKNGELEVALDELRELQSELIQSEKLAGIGTLAAGIAHEISSPLFGIMGLAEAIQEEEDPALVRQYAADIVDYSRTIKDIVVDLTGYSRTAQAEYMTTIDLVRVVEDAVRLVRRSIASDTISVSVDIPEGLLVSARTSEVQQVFVNLVKNSIEALLERYPGGTGGEVRLQAGRGESGVWARIADNGPGIPEDRLAVIFDPFYTTKPPGKGTGLGLNIVYRIMTKYRGSVSVESRVGHGTTFLLRFPVEDAG